MSSGRRVDVAKDWDPTEVLAALDLEQYPETTPGGDVIVKDPESIAKKTAVNAVAFAMKRIVHIACYSENESRALAASTYIVDRVFGKVTDAPMSVGTEEDSLRTMVDAAYSRGD